MRMPPAAVLFVLSLATPAAAQVWTPPGGHFGPDAHRGQVERHRLEMDRLRAGAAQRELEVRQSQLEARLTQLELERRRQAEPLVIPPRPALRTLDVETEARVSATRRREQTQAGVGQIDEWLDRPAE